MRNFSPTDRILGSVDQAIRLVFGPPPHPERPTPAASIPETELTAEERDLSARLMRINHAGEICAQALYQGQAMTARLEDVREKMEQAAREENDHLAWTDERVRQLGSHTSYLNPVWYAGSFAIGALAGLAGDRWSLGFLAETERQVVDHLNGHLERIPSGDARSRAILVQMRDDEGKHATTALESGGAPLPRPIQGLMRLLSRVMTRTAYWI